MHQCLETLVEFAGKSSFLASSARGISIHQTLDFLFATGSACLDLSRDLRDVMLRYGR